MTDKRCLCAHTTLAPSYPAYFNISQHANGDVEVIVRSNPVLAYAGSPGHTVCGSEASMRMTAREFQELLLDAVRAFRS